MLKSYITIAWRSLRRHLGYTAINLVGFSLGIASFLLVTFYVMQEYSFDRYHPDGDRLYRVVGLGGMESSLKNVGMPGNPLEELRTSYSEVDVATEVRPCQTDRMMVDGNWFLNLDMRCTDSKVFDMFGFELLQGNPTTVLERPHTAVITQSLARRVFGNRDPVGQSLPIDFFGSPASFEITGLMGDVPANTHFRTDLFLSQVSLLSTEVCLDCGGAEVYARLNPGADPAVVSSRLAASITEQYSYLDNVALEPVSAIHFSEYGAERGGDQRYVYLLLVIGVVVLLLACANYMNLATARAIGRAREVGLRKVVGARRQQIVRQFLIEALLIAVLALPMAAILLVLVLPSFNRLAETDISLLTQLDGRLVIVLIGILLTVGILAGSYPALFLSRYSPVSIFQKRIALSGARLRKGLVVFQFAVSIALLAGTLIISDQLNFIQQRNLGFDRDQVVVVPLVGDDVMAKYVPIREAFTRTAGVREATAGTGVPGQRRFGWMRFFLKPFEGDDATVFLVRPLIDKHMLATFDIPLIAGRNITGVDELKETLINTAAVEAMRWESPEAAIGQTITGNHRVVGVIADMHYESLHQEIMPLMMGTVGGNNMPGYIAVKLGGGEIETALDGLKHTWEDMGIEMPFEYTFLDEEIAKMYEQEQRAESVFGLFTGLAILIACMGLFGLVAFAAAQRTREFGIRRVLGATWAHIARALTGDFLVLIGVAALIAVPVAYMAAERWLEAFAFRITVAPAPFIVAGVCALLIALVTMSLQVMRSTAADPVESLRHE